MSNDIMVPVGTPVLFYRHSDLEGEAYPATVLRSFQNGVVRLLIFHTNGDTEIGTAVHHYHSQQLRTEDGRLNDNALRNGCWNYHPWFEPPVQFQCGTDCSTAAPEKEPKAKKKGDILTFDEQEKKVLEIIDEGDFDYVYKRAKFWGVTRTDLELIFTKHGKMCDLGQPVG